MPQTAIFGPVFATIFLTLVVWVYMYIRRVSFITRNKISPTDMAVPGKLAAISPPEVSNPSDNSAHGPDAWHARVNDAWRFYYFMDGDTYVIYQLQKHPKSTQRAR